MTSRAPGDEFFKGAWLEEFQTTAQAIAAFRSRITAGIRLRVLVWGPGVASRHYPKRKQIMDHLKALHPGDDVTTSEELMKSAEFEGLTDLEKEDLHWRFVHAVVALVPEDLTASGVRIELATFGLEPEFLDKCCMIVPKLTPGRIRRLPLQEKAWYQLQPSRRFGYTSAQYHDCTQIRAFCGTFVDQARTRAGYQTLRRAIRPDG